MALRTENISQGLLGIDWWCRIEPARIEPLTSAPLKKKENVQHRNSDIQEIKQTSKGCDLWKCQTVE